MPLIRRQMVCDSYDMVRQVQEAHLTYFRQVSICRSTAGRR